jgi:hypothetical protein
VLPDERVLLFDAGTTLDALWEGYERAARQNQAFYDKKYALAKGEWLEGKVVQGLQRVFPSGSVFQSLHYPDPDKSKGATAELDVAVQWGPFLILIEAKAKQFRLRTHHKNRSQLKRDVEANIEDAFEQTRRVLRYLNQVAAPVFVEKATGRHLVINKEKLQRVYALTVSQHYLAGLANQPHLLTALGLFKDGSFPVSLDIGTLEIILETCEAPNVFLHYLERRVQLQKTHPHIRGDELEFYGAYLQSRLQTSPFRNADSNDRISLHGFKEDFERFMRHKYGVSDKQADIALRLPNEIKELLQLLRKDSGDAARGIAFSLLTLSDRALHHISEAITTLRDRPVTPGTLFRNSIVKDDLDDTAIFILVSVNQTQQTLDKHLEVRLHLEKYRLRATKAIGIGVMLPLLGKPVTTLRWLEHPWRFDEDREALLNSPDIERAELPVPGQSLPGRNEPCYCGNGKKFKHCHLKRIEATRRLLRGEE